MSQPTYEQHKLWFDAIMRQIQELRSELYSTRATLDEVVRELITVKAERDASVLRQIKDAKDAVNDVMRLLPVLEKRP
jgi:hypothetical protein